VSSFLLKPRDHFIDVFDGQVEVQRLVVLTQPMLRHSYVEWRAAITTAIVIAMLLGVAIYQALELERLR